MAQSVVADRFAVCANILPRIASYFWWDDLAQSEQEIAVVLVVSRIFRTFCQATAPLVEVCSA